MLHPQAHCLPNNSVQSRNLVSLTTICTTRPCLAPLAHVVKATAPPSAVAAAAASNTLSQQQQQSSVDPSTQQTPAVNLDPEVKAKHKRPQGWVVPGPPPAAAAAKGPLDPDLDFGPDETLSYLTGDWRIFQLRNGHRWSMDDMMTAYIALQTVQQPPLRQPAAAAAATAADASAEGVLGSLRYVLDMGCGIGSVLLMVAWGLRRMAAEQQQQHHHHQQQQGQEQQQQQQAVFPISSLGVEAQAVSYGLAVRSVRYNLGDAAGQEVQVINQDLRQPLPPSAPQAFQLITGTPPYIPPGSGGQSNKPQKGPCCVEIRGGIEDYCTAAAAVLAPGGHFVVCCGLQGQPFKGRRVQRAAAAANLVITRQVTVVTKEGKPPLFGVYVMKHCGDVMANAEAWVQQQQQQGQVVGSSSSSSSSGSSDSNNSSSSSSSSLAAQVANGQLNGSEEVFVVRDASGQHTAAWHAAREAMGLPPLQQ